MTKKHCPVCGSEAWNYDVVIYAGPCFCGDCFSDVRNIGKDNNLCHFDTKTMSWK
jgi:hypothetical protein